MFPTKIQSSELVAALRQAIATGRMGTVVNARLHWQVPAKVRLEDAAEAAVVLADSALQLSETQWRVRRASRGNLLHVLGRDDRGRTLVVTVNHGTPEAQLTVFGNHGVVRLDRAILDWDSGLLDSSPGSAAVRALRTQIKSGDTSAISEHCV